jgi:AcrR family transcriptional regulator
MPHRFDAVKLACENLTMSPRSDPSYPADVRAALIAAARAELLERGVTDLSLRAIAARAGVSRATPKWHFRDRAGLLTALAVEGFGQLDAALRGAVSGLTEPSARFTALGRAYMDFGLANPDLFELMFRSDQLDRDDPTLTAAQQQSFSVLVDTAAETGEATAAAAGDIPLLAWACAHGLVMLVRGGALQRLTGLPTHDQAADLAHRLADTFTKLVPA